MSVEAAESPNAEVTIAIPRQEESVAVENPTPAEAAASAVAHIDQVVEPSPFDTRPEAAAAARDEVETGARNSPMV